MLRHPVVVPLWATNPPGGAIVEPVALTQQNGFATGDRPPAQWLNWELANIGACLDYALGPTLKNWTRLDVSAWTSGDIIWADVDNDSTELSVTAPLRRMLAIGVTSGSPNTLHLYASERGELWTQVDGGVPTVITTGANTVAWINLPGTLGSPTPNSTGTWLIGTLTGNVYNGVASGVGAGLAPIDGGASWSVTTSPASDKIQKFAVDNAGNVIAISLTKIMAGVLAGGAVATLTEVTYAGSAKTGTFTDVIFDGTSWVAVTSVGEIFTATTAAGTWTRESSTLGTPTGGGQIGWGLRCDGYRITSTAPQSGATVIVAFPRSSTQYGWFTSVDHGATWQTLTQPSALNAGLTNLYDLQFIDGAWFAAGQNTPYLQTTNKITDPTQWVPIQIPFYSDTVTDGGSHGPVIFSEGRLLAFAKKNFVLATDRAVQLAPGPYAPPGTPAQLHDAAYLRGTLVSSTAPTDGQSLVYVAADGEWEPKSVTPPLFSPSSTTVTFPLTGTHDYTADAAYSPATYPDNQTGVLTGRLGDGVTAPTFFAYNKVNISALALTSGNTLRMTTSASSMTGDVWPFADTAGGAPMLMIPLPPLETGVLQFTMKSNITGAYDGGDNISVSVGILRAQESTFPRGVAFIQWETFGVHSPSEHIYLHGHSYAVADLATWTSAGVTTRVYQIDLDGPGAAVQGEPAGGGSMSLIHGRNDPELIASRRDYMLCLRIYAPSGISVNPYVEIGGLSILGARQ